MGILCSETSAKRCLHACTAAVVCLLHVLAHAAALHNRTGRPSWLWPCLQACRGSIHARTAPRHGLQCFLNSVPAAVCNSTESCSCVCCAAARLMHAPATESPTPSLSRRLQAKNLTRASASASAAAVAAGSAGSASKPRPEEGSAPATAQQTTNTRAGASSSPPPGGNVPAAAAVQSLCVVPLWKPPQC